jgi:hypothetical protein
MLGVKTYEPTYIEGCRTQLRDLLGAYDEVAAGAKRAAVEELTPRFLANLVLTLDAFFVHRLRTVEGKDGNPLNEVRMLVEAILQNDGVLRANTTIKYKPATSVLGYEIGAPIRLDRAAFDLLAERYFEELEKRFT